MVSEFSPHFPKNYPLVKVYSSLLKLAIEIVDLPMKMVDLSIVFGMFTRGYHEIMRHPAFSETCHHEKCAWMVDGPSNEN